MCLDKNRVFLIIKTGLRRIIKGYWYTKNINKLEYKTILYGIIITIKKEKTGMQNLRISQKYT